jgi:hypothetical protein
MSLSDVLFLFQENQEKISKLPPTIAIPCSNNDGQASSHLSRRSISSKFSIPITPHSNTPTVIMPMPKSCTVCKAVASPELYCSACQSALYCSKDCQRKDWKQQHKNICKRLNKGHGDMQVRTDSHTHQFHFKNGEFEKRERSFDKDGKRFFKLFQESTFGTSRAAALKMTKIIQRKSKNYQELLLYHSFDLLIQSKSEMLSWPNSPLLVLLQFVDSNVVFDGEATTITPLHHLALLLDPSNYSTHVNQLILAKQLIQQGANVNAVSIPQNTTPLHTACYSGVVTNLDFIELLLEAGSDPNAQHDMGMSPLMVTTKLAPGAAKFMMNWPATNVNIIPRSGESFLVKVRAAITALSIAAAHPGNPEQVQHQFVLQQWREIEEMLVERGAR